MKQKLFGIFVACATVATPVCSFAEAVASSSTNERLAEIDREIQKLKNDREGASMESYIEGDSADQHLDQSWPDYQEDINAQESSQQQVKSLDAKISELEKEKASLLKE